MIIRKKRIRKISSYLSKAGIKEGEPFYFVLDNIDEYQEQLRKIGFLNLEERESVIPIAIGNKTKENSEGKVVIRKDLPKQDIYHDVTFEHPDWHGRMHTSTASRRYKTYPREQQEPARERLILRKYQDNNILTSTLFSYDLDNIETITLVANIFLELFGQCEIRKESLSPIIKNTKKLDWEILPSGDYPWDKFKDTLKEFAEKRKKDSFQEIERRLEFIKSMGKHDTYTGSNGFNGYLIIFFHEKNIAILESVYLDNATYVLEDDWLEKSRLTKKDILSNEFHKARIVHNDFWEENVTMLFQ